LSWPPFGSRPENQPNQGDSGSRVSGENQFNDRQPAGGAMVDLSGHFQDYRLSSKLHKDRSARSWVGRFVNDLAFSDDRMNPNRGIEVKLSDNRDNGDSAQSQGLKKKKVKSSWSDYLTRDK
jgi:hypothetical protein